MDLYSNSLRDPGDKYDSLKWDFDESNYDIIYLGGYPYKVLDTISDDKQELVARKLHKLRLLNNKITDNMRRFAKGPGVDIYEYIHKNNNGTSNYLLSQIKPSTGFLGLNKPKNRVRTNDPFVGPDENIRARQRDIFLTINSKTEKITEPELELFIHELAHTLSNHVQYRPDDHNLDFQASEKLLWKIINSLYD